MTAYELADELGKTVRAIHSSIWSERERRGTDRLRVRGWKRAYGTSGRPSPIYGLGPGNDAKRPVALTKAQRGRRYREKHAIKLRLMQSYRRGQTLVGNPWAGLGAR